MIPKVAVIVPCYNQGAYVEEALMSIKTQTYSNWVCVIVNDASTDNSDVTIRKFLDSIKDDRFSYICLDRNKGVAHARNLAINSSDSEYILPLDADDVINCSYLAETVPILETQDAVKLVYTDAKEFGIKQADCFLPEFTMSTMCHMNPFHATSLFRRSTYGETQGYRSNMKYGYEDWDLWLQMIQNVSEVFKIPKMLFYARQKTSSRNTTLIQNPEMELAMRQQLRSNNPGFFKLNDLSRKVKRYNIFSRLRNMFSNS